MASIGSSSASAADPSYPPLLTGTGVSPPSLPGEEPIDIPVFDLENLETERLGDACRSMGLFRLVNHGLPREVSLRLGAEARRILKLPFERKRSEMSGPGRGKPVMYFWGTPAVSSILRNVNWLEGLQVPLAVFQDGDCGGWNASNGCSDSFRILIEEYKNHMIHIIKTLFHSMALDLKLDPSLSKSQMDAPNGIFRAYRYPILPESQSFMGLGAHTDSSVLTIVDQDEVGGLQIRHENKWFDITPVANTLIVNVGDMLQVISNDEYKSMEHRVLANGTKERMSLCYFAFPEEDYKIRSLRYREFSYREFKAQVEEDIKETGDKVGLKRFMLQ